jgi:preprotein translocase subunit YajC
VPAYAQLLVILVAFLGFWAIVMRPARNQQKKVQNLQQQLEVGQEVVLSAGIFGTIRSLSETRAEIEVAPGTVITVARQVVVRRADELEDTTRPEATTPETTTPETTTPESTGSDPAGPSDTTGPTRTED